MRQFSACLLCLVLLGCGGGETSTSASNPPVRNVGVEIRLRHMIGELRARNQLPPLEEDARLEAVARAHATYCLDIGDVRHEDAGGGNVGNRLSAVGIDFREAGEILGRDRLSPDPAESLFREWMRSLGHRRELVHPAFTRMGIAVVERGGVVYAAVVFLNP